VIDQARTRRCDVAPAKPQYQDAGKGRDAWASRQGLISRTPSCPAVSTTMARAAGA
jgi:hypothetical protein